MLNSNGTYTRTLTDGTQENFNSSGLETTSVDRNGLTTTFGYSSSLLQTITDPFGEITTFTYSSGHPPVDRGPGRPAHDVHDVERRPDRGRVPRRRPPGITATTAPAG